MYAGNASIISWLGALPPLTTCRRSSITEMGVVLTPIVEPQTIALSTLRDRTLAVDGNGELYQFLALIRLRALSSANGMLVSRLPSS